MYGNAVPCLSEQHVRIEERQKERKLVVNLGIIYKVCKTYSSVVPCLGKNTEYIGNKRPRHEQ